MLLGESDWKKPHPDDFDKGHPRKVRSWKLEVGPGQTTKNAVGLLGCVTPLEDIVMGEDTS